MRRKWSTGWYRTYCFSLKYISSTIPIWGRSQRRKKDNIKFTCPGAFSLTFAMCIYSHWHSLTRLTADCLIFIESNNSVRLQNCVDLLDSLSRCMHSGLFQLCCNQLTECVTECPTAMHVSNLALLLPFPPVWPLYRSLRSSDKDICTVPCCPPTSLQAHA